MLQSMGSQSTGRLSDKSPSVGDGLGVNVDPCTWSTDARKLSGRPWYPGGHT